MEEIRVKEVCLESEDHLTVGASRYELYHFGDVSVRVSEHQVNVWTCYLEETAIGLVRYDPRKKREGVKGRDYGFSAFVPSGDGSMDQPATDINLYSSLRSGVQAVVACHFSRKIYTYIRDNICVIDGRVVPELTYRRLRSGRKKLS